MKAWHTNLICERFSRTAANFFSAQPIRFRAEQRVEKCQHRQVEPIQRPRVTKQGFIFPYCENALVYNSPGAVVAKVFQSRRIGILRLQKFTTQLIHSIGRF
jgi:hypothetical protein